MKALIFMTCAVMLLSLAPPRVSAGDGPSERVRRLALHLKSHYNYRDFNEYGAVAYGKVYELENGLVNVYYADQNENRRVDGDDSLHIIDENGNTVLSFVDMGLDGIQDEGDLAGEVNASGTMVRQAQGQAMNERYLLLVDDLLRRR
jgi:hypothetical protein